MTTTFDLNNTDKDRTKSEAEQYIKNVDKPPQIVKDVLDALVNIGKSDNQENPQVVVDAEIVEEPPTSTETTKNKTTKTIEAGKETDQIEAIKIKIKNLNTMEKLEFAKELLDEFTKQEGITLKELQNLQKEDAQEENRSFLQRYGGAIGTIAFCLAIYNLVNTDEGGCSAEMVQNASALESLICGK